MDPSWKSPLTSSFSGSLWARFVFHERRTRSFAFCPRALKECADSTHHQALKDNMRMHVFSSPLIWLFPDVPGAFHNSMGFIQLGLKWFEVAALCCLQDMLDSTIDPDPVEVPGPVEVFSQEMVIWVHELGCITCWDMPFFLAYTVARVKWESYETWFGVNFFAWFCWTLAPLRGPCRSIAVVWRFADGFAVLCWNKSGQDGTALCEDHVLYVHVCSGSNLKPSRVRLPLESCLRINYVDFIFVFIHPWEPIEWK